MSCEVSAVLPSGAGEPISLLYDGLLVGSVSSAPGPNKVDGIERSGAAPPGTRQSCFCPAEYVDLLFLGLIVHVSKS